MTEQQHSINPADHPYSLTKWTSPSLEEIQFLESYLAHKYGFAEKLPADHPCKGPSTKN